MRIEQELRIELCASLHFLLERHIQEPDWPSDAWVDGLFPDRIAALTRDALEIPGSFLWVQGQDRWWMEPGFAAVDLDAGAYTLKVRDASKGLRSAPYQTRRRAVIWIEPTEWMFTFVGKLYSIDR